MLCFFFKNLSKIRCIYIEVLGDIFYTGVGIMVLYVLNNGRNQGIDAMFSGILYKKEDKKWNSCYRN